MSDQTETSWEEVTGLAEPGGLSEDLSTEVCVVGAGIAGLTTAYLLARQGRGVVVIDDAPRRCGESRRSTAHLSSVLEDRFSVLERRHGLAWVRAAAESHSAAIDTIQAVCTLERIDCGFERVDGYLFTEPGSTAAALEDDLAAVRRAGLRAELTPRAPFSAFETGPALCFPRQAQFEPRKYLAGLQAALLRLGGRIYGSTAASEVSGGSPARIETVGGAVIAAQAVVVATNSPINGRLRLHAKQAAYRTYVTALPVPKGSVPKALFWDTCNPYHYVRLQEGLKRDLLIVGGEDHRTAQGGDAPRRYADLEAWSAARFPVCGPAEHRWSGQVMETMDGLAYIGHNPTGPANVYIATGDSGMGLTHGTIAGILLSDALMGRANAWAPFYDPARKPLRALERYARANLNAAAQYKRWLTPGQTRRAEDIAPGAGAVLRRGLRKVAVYRDEGGALHERSARCPHLGCVVAWNGDESSWDCPCHGSRFDPYGAVLNGPAMRPLARLDD